MGIENFHYAGAYIFNIRIWINYFRFVYFNHPFFKFIFFHKNRPFANASIPILQGAISIAVKIVLVSSGRKEIDNNYQNYKNYT